jgi:hypothetical protein
LPECSEPPPADVTQSGTSSRLSRCARIDFPMPGPPHMTRNVETSWKHSYACSWPSRIRCTASPLTHAPVDRKAMLNTFQWPHGEKSGAAIAALCANARLIVPLLASGCLGLTLRVARSPHSRIACLVPFHTDTQPGGIFCCSRDDVNAWSKRRSPSRSAASVPCE